MYYSVSSKSASFNPLYRMDIASRHAMGKGSTITQSQLRFVSFQLLTILPIVSVSTVGISLFLARTLLAMKQQMQGHADSTSLMIMILR